MTSPTQNKGEGGKKTTSLNLERHYSDLVQQRCFCCHFTSVDNLSHRDVTD